MNKANQGTNRACLELLQLAARDRVLEVGPGNGAFAGDIVASAKHVTYTGLDWSAEMVDALATQPVKSGQRGRIILQASIARPTGPRAPFPHAVPDCQAQMAGSLLRAPWPAPDPKSRLPGR